MRRLGWLQYRRQDHRKSRGARNYNATDERGCFSGTNGDILYSCYRYGPTQFQVAEERGANQRSYRILLYDASNDRR